MSRKRRKVGCNKESMKKQLVAGIVVAVAWVLSARADVDSFFQERLDDWLRSSMIAPAEENEDSQSQKQLERGLYYCTPDDDLDEDPPYVPLRHRDALKEFKSYLDSGWTTNQVIEGLILAMTNNFAAALSGNREKGRIVGAAIWKLGEINHKQLLYRPLSRHSLHFRPLLLQKLKHRLQYQARHTEQFCGSTELLLRRLFRGVLCRI